MKTKIIPFDLETAKKIQEGLIAGAIKTRGDGRKMMIVCYDSTAIYCGKTQPIIAQDDVDCARLRAYFEDGRFRYGGDDAEDLVLEVPDTEPQFKPFDRVLVRDYDDSEWCLAFYAYYREKINEHRMVGGTCWEQCIPYEGNEHLLGTTLQC